MDAVTRITDLQNKGSQHFYPITEEKQQEGEMHDIVPNHVSVATHILINYCCCLIILILITDMCVIVL